VMPSSTDGISGAQRLLRVAFLLTGVLALIGIAISITLDSMFEEPAARVVPSLVDELGSKSVLAFFAHPDDEILVCGALADAARRGCEVRTVTATRGERGAPKGFTGTRADLVQLRETELRTLGAKLGIREQLLWDFPDGGLADVPIELLRDSVVAAVRRFQPDLILSMDSTAGFTGHSDHRRIGAAVLLALSVPDSLSADSGGGSPRRLAQVILPRRVSRFLPGETGARLRRQPAPTFAMNVDPRVRLLSMKTHASQQRNFPPRWSRPILLHFYDREYFALRQ
jgi:LmbE family N-acetylglucosaminyl deacetylase